MKCEESELGHVLGSPVSHVLFFPSFPSVGDPVSRLASRMLALYGRNAM